MTVAEDSRWTREARDNRVRLRDGALPQQRSRMAADWLVARVGLDTAPRAGTHTFSVAEAATENLRHRRAAGPSRHQALLCVRCAGPLTGRGICSRCNPRTP